MVKAGVVYATATEDMDSLTFGSNIMLHHLTASEAKLVAMWYKASEINCFRSSANWLLILKTKVNYMTANLSAPVLANNLK